RTPFNELYLYNVIIAEIRFGPETAAHPLRRKEIATWLDAFARPRFAGRIIAVNEAVFLQWRLLRDAGRRSGYPFPEPALLIAATACHYGLIVLSRDIEPCQRANVSAVNPWRA